MDWEERIWIRHTLCIQMYCLCRSQHARNGRLAMVLRTGIRSNYSEQWYSYDRNTYLVSTYLPYAIPRVLFGKAAVMEPAGGSAWGKVRAFRALTNRRPQFIVPTKAPATCKTDKVLIFLSAGLTSRARWLYRTVCSIVLRQTCGSCKSEYSPEV